MDTCRECVTKCTIIESQKFIKVRHFEEDPSICLSIPMARLPSMPRYFRWEKQRNR